MEQRQKNRVILQSLQQYSSREAETNLGPAHEQIQDQNASDPVDHSVKQSK